MQSEFDYYAFISYKREDEQWAQWLQKKLEGYNIPSAIRKEIPRVPKHVRPIFRDKTDLGAGGLTTSLHAELERSKYLIVICSPHSAQSDWVGKEINHFRQLGREVNVIPFIVSGLPHSEDPNTECFNPVFDKFKDEPLGINVQEIGRSQALVKVLAKLLDLRFDKLWDRHKRNLRVKKIWCGAACAFLALLGFLYWEYTRPTYKYYADIIDRWGVPEGVIPLDRENRHHRGTMYRFEYRRIPIGQRSAFSWRLSKVAYVNSYGTVIEHSDSELMDRSSIMQIIYGNESGDVIQINYCNERGKVIMRNKISSKDGVPASLIDLHGSADNEASGYLAASTTSMRNSVYSSENGASTIKRLYLTRNSKGLITRRTYHSSNSDDFKSSSTRDKNGIFGVDYTLDSLGRVIEMRYLDNDYQPFSTQSGISKKRYEYDRYGNFSRQSYLDLNDKLTYNDEKVAECIFTSDKYGNVTEQISLGPDGNPCYCKYGYHKMKCTYDYFKIAS